MEKTLIVYKKVGQTPLDAVREFKKNNPSYKNETVSYAGRLDPMAEGALLLLIGDENRKRKEYEGLMKEYETEIVLGISTDTFDGMGLVQKSSDQRQMTKSKILKCLANFIGKNIQKYPPYSSKAVNGKPLYWWSRQNRISEIEIPEREIEIYELVVGSLSFVSCEELVDKILEKIKLVKGDFRQEEIIKQWEEFGIRNKGQKFQIIGFKVSCSSGTYIRRLASDLGDQLSCGAFALSIKRTKIGEDSIRLSEILET